MLTFVLCCEVTLYKVEFCVFLASTRTATPEEHHITVKAHTPLCCMPTSSADGVSTDYTSLDVNQQ
jgi:hypothetical protein